MNYCGVVSRFLGERDKNMTRRQEREETFLMIFEGEFDHSRTAEDIYGQAKESREVGESEYISTVLSGVIEKRDELGALIEKHSRGWQRDRITHSASAAMLLAVYEMKYMPELPTRVSINEALELIKKYDDDKARVFVNGVLHAVATELGEQA